MHYVEKYVLFAAIYFFIMFLIQSLDLNVCFMFETASDWFVVISLYGPEILNIHLLLVMVKCWSHFPYLFFVSTVSIKYSLFANTCIQ